MTPTPDDDILRALLREDAPHGDLTTQGLGLAGQRAQVRFTARAAGVASGLEEAARLFGLCGVDVTSLARAGTPQAAGDTLLQAEGDASDVLLAWKTAQTLAEAMGGIAGAVAQIVGALAAAGLPVPLACTRKNFPGTRVFAARAVRAGGGVMHRLGLSETLLVFPEHMALLPPGDVAARLAALKRQQPEKRLVVEVGCEDDALAMARAGADVLQLERFSPDALQALKAALAAQGLTPRLAPAGGVNGGNAEAYARAGADFLVSSAPYFAPPADIQVRITPAG